MQSAARLAPSVGAASLADQTAAVGQRAQDGLEHAGERVTSFTKHNSLVAGALAVAGGVAAALLLPKSEIENRLLGETRDRLLGKVQGSASDLVQRVQRSAEHIRGALAEFQPA